MFGRVRTWASAQIQRYVDVDEFDSKKIIYFSLGFFLIISANSILRALKTSIFLGIIGKEHLPKTYVLSILMLAPCMFIYSKLVDKFKRHQLVYLILIVYAIGALIFALFLMHPTIGLKNTQTSPYRLIGWGFEFFIDFYQALVIGTFWSFINSVSTTQFSTKSYGLIVATSRIGGILASVLGLLVMQYSHMPSWHAVPILIGMTSIFLVLTAYLVFKVKNTIPKDHLFGYKREVPHVGHATKKPKHSVFDGLKMMLAEPYVLGIFGLLFCFEVISIVFDYQLQVLMSIELKNNVIAMSSFMMIYTIAFQITGLIFALAGTISLLRWLGLQVCLMLGPVIAFVAIICFMLCPKLIMLFLIMVVMRAMHYGFNMPLREMLYVPTVKDIQFKSKAWIDSFGRSFSKSFGSAFNEASRYISVGLGLILSSAFSLCVVSAWAAIAFLIGKKYLTAVAEKKIIGATEQNDYAADSQAENTDKKDV